MVEVLPVETPTLGDRSYLAHDGPANTAGPAGPDLSPPRRADAAEVRRAIQAGEWVVDLRTQDVLDRTRVILVLPTAAMLSPPDWAKVLEGVAATPLADPASPFGYVRVDKLKRYGLPSLYWNLMLKGLA